MNMDYKEVIGLVKECRGLILNHEKAQQVTEKGRADYVTQVDLSVQRFLQSSLAGRWPEVQFLGEEGQKEKPDFTRPVWILDPVDGTTNLIHDYQTSCVALGLWDGADLAFGCVYNPFREELYTAVKGQGAFLNGSPIRVSSRPTVAKSLLLVGTTPYEKNRSAAVFELIRRMFVACEDIRRSGSAALDICSVAAGRCEGFFEYNLKPWDYAAASVILTEAGGTFTLMDGSAPAAGENADVLCTNGAVHGEMLAIIREAEGRS